MIIYGTRAKHLKTDLIETDNCPICKTNSIYKISVFGRYFHVFWLPMFPIGKVTVGECSHCMRTIKSGDMPKELFDKTKEIERRGKIPLWMFIGLVLFAILIVQGIIGNDKHKDDVSKFISTPQQEDKYEIKLSSGNFTIYKVSRVTADSVFLCPNRYEIDISTKLHKIDKDENYMPIEDGYSKAEVKQMYERKIILDIKR